MALVRMLDEVKTFLAREHGHYIDGRAVAGRGERIDVRDPSTRAVIGSVAQATDDDVEAAIASSHRAFRGEWASLTPADRERILLRFADLIDAHGEEIAQTVLMILDMPSLTGQMQALDGGEHLEWPGYRGPTPRGAGK